MEIAAAGKKCHRLLSGVDQIGIFMTFGGRGTHPQQAIFAMEKNLPITGKVVGNRRRQAYPEIDVGALRNVPRDPRRQLVSAKALDRRVHAAACGCDGIATASTATTRRTKMPGVTIT